MSEEKNVLEEVVAAIKKLLGFGNEEQITAAVNGIVDAKGDEAGVVSALQGLFGKAIPQADLASVVSGFLGKGNGIDLGNILELFQGIGDKVGGFDKIAGLVGMASGAGKVTDAVKASAGSVTGAVAAAAGKATDAAAGVASGVADAATGVASGAADAAASVATGAADAAASAATGVADAATGAASTVTGAVKGAATSAVNAVEGAVDGVKQVAAEPAVKRKKKWPIVVGVIVAVVALAGIGMWIWHEQPSFCNAFCHTSMDAYVESYDQQDNAAGIDKYGNAVTNTHAMLVVSHKSADLACLDCHVPAIDQQIGEVMETISGNYTVLERANGAGYALEEVSLSALQENAHHANDSGKGDEFCLRSGCHDFTRDVLMTATESMAFNPHRAQHGEIACGECHKSHRASVFYCTRCHSEAVEAMPDGWLTYQEGQAVLNGTAA